MKRESIILYPMLDSRDVQSYLPINNSVYTTILSSINKETAGRTAQSHVIIGTNGSGKTILLRRIALELCHSATFQPIAIDGQKLFSVDDIWKYGPGGNFESIINWQIQHNRCTVFLIDNIQYLFRRIDNAAQFSLRGKLNNIGAPILIATSNEVLPAFTDYKAAFFDGLKLSYIRPINNETVQALGFSDRELHRVNILLQHLPKTIRSLFLIKRVLQLSAHATDDINILCDLFTPTFQLKYDSYVTQSQRILSALASSESGMTLQQLREATQQKSGALSPYLKAMIIANIIEKNAQTTRNTTYYIKDNLFRL
jgi:hypothetical protein